MDKERAVVDLLIGKYEKNGHITEDEIFDACEEYDLELSSIDRVGNQLNMLGVLIADTSNGVNTDEDDPYKNSRTMSVTVKHIGFSLCIIPEYIEYNSKKIRTSYKKSIANFKYKLKKYSLILLIGIIYLIHEFAYIFSDRFMYIKGK